MLKSSVTKTAIALGLLSGGRWQNGSTATETFMVRITVPATMATPRVFTTGGDRIFGTDETFVRPVFAGLRTLAPASALAPAVCACLLVDLKKSKLAEAIRYAISRRAALERFLSDGRVEIGRVDDRRGGCGSRGVAVVRRLSPNAGASFRTVAPFPVAARQTGRAELPHPAFSHPIRPSLSAGRSAGGECGRGRASHRDTRPGSGGTRRLVSQLGASTSGGVVDLWTS